MEAYIFHGQYHSDFASYDFGSTYVEEADIDQDHWARALTAEDGIVEIRPESALYLYGGRTAMLEALATARGQLTHDFSIRPLDDEDSLMVAYAVVKVPFKIGKFTIPKLKRGVKRLIMICQSSDDRAQEIGAENLLADANGNTTVPSLTADELVGIVDNLPDE
jgi:hypothetical protein